MAYLVDLGSTFDMLIAELINILCANIRLYKSISHVSMAHGNNIIWQFNCVQINHVCV